MTEMTLMNYKPLNDRNDTRELYTPLNDRNDTHEL